LLEHWVFCLFYNWPLTIRRRMRRRAEQRASIRPRFWHVPVCAVLAAGIFGLVDHSYFGQNGNLPSLREFWPLVAGLPLLCGAAVSLASGGATLARRVISALVAGVFTALLAVCFSALIVRTGSTNETNLLVLGVWRIFIFSILSVAGAMASELTLPEPKKS
jgi:hypothetical protein